MQAKLIFKTLVTNNKIHVNNMWSYDIHANLVTRACDPSGKYRKLWDNPCGEDRFLYLDRTAHAFNIIELM